MFLCFWIPMLSICALWTLWAFCVPVWICLFHIFISGYVTYIRVKCQFIIALPHNSEMSVHNGEVLLHNSEMSVHNNKLLPHNSDVKWWNLSS